MRHRLTAALALLLAATPLPALAWDSAGHRTITYIALDGFKALAPDRPAFLADDNARHMAAFQSSEPDRYRSLTKSLYLKHENEPDHYLDVEDLEKFGLTLETMPKLRYEYVRALCIAQHEHPVQPDAAKGIAAYDPATDPQRSKEFPGYALHAVMEHHAKLVSAFKTYRQLTALNDLSRAPQLEMTKANILAEMGHLSHFVGDLAQPLHTTRHHHGWVGDNPDGFTTERKFHSYMDGDILVHHQLVYANLREKAKFTPFAPDTAEVRADHTDRWPEAVALVKRTFEKVRPLYMLEKTGELKLEAGKDFVGACILDGGQTLGAFYASAWEASKITDADPKDFVRWDGWPQEPGVAKETTPWDEPPAPAPAPAPAKSRAPSPPAAP